MRINKKSEQRKIQTPASRLQRRRRNESSAAVIIQVTCQIRSQTKAFFPGTIMWIQQRRRKKQATWYLYFFSSTYVSDEYVHYIKTLEGKGETGVFENGR
jgi:hypothetical protein